LTARRCQTQATEST